ncbi:MAG TPA: hypothetical protein VH062_30810 [Polyangiaceae bacterium]|jgi:hypothetical protein|nr:hypothetical protein [Polyangiaceae bacterium]
MRFLVFSAVVALAGLGCDRFDRAPTPPGEPPPPPSAPPRPSSSATAPRLADGGLPPLPMDPKLRRSLKLSPLRVHDAGLAIGKYRLAVLSGDEIVVRDTTKFAEVTRVPMHEPRNLTAMVDGSFLSADPMHTAWLLPGNTRARSLPRVVLLPESMLFADRRSPDRFWVLSGHGTTLFGYALGSSTLGILVANEWVSLDGYDARLFGSLRDGSFLYSVGGGFRQFYGPTKKSDIEGDPSEAFRLLPASRVDTIWLVSKETAVLYRLLAGKLVKLQTVPFSAMAYDVEADGQYLAVLELAQPDDAPWTFTLEVFDVDGKRRLHEALPTTESFEQDRWVAALTRNRHLALAAGDTPLVAVGGPDELNVFRADKGTRVLSAP